MFAKTFAVVATTAAFAASVLAQSPLTINTPAVARQCLHTQVTWEGGSGLFFLRVLKDGTEPIQEFGGLPATQHSLDWQTNVKRGTNVTLEIADEAGEIATTAAFTILRGRNNCTVVS